MKIDEYQLKVDAAITPCCDHDPCDWVHRPEPALRRGWVFLGGCFVCTACSGTGGPAVDQESSAGKAE